MFELMVGFSNQSAARRLKTIYRLIAEDEPK